MKTIRILVADDHTLFREGLRQLLEMEKDLQVVSEADDGSTAIDRARELAPDVILMDINMPLVDGVAACQQILAASPESAIIMLTMSRQDRHVFEAMRAGARGYLLKDAKPADLVIAIRTVAQGGSMIDPRLATTVLKEFRRLASQAEEDEGIAGLTPKEIEILKLLAMGLSNREIGARLFLAEKTVKNYLSTIFQKLEITDRVQAAIYALRHGLVTGAER